LEVLKGWKIAHISIIGRMVKLKLLGPGLIGLDPLGNWKEPFHWEGGLIFGGLGGTFEGRLELATKKPGVGV